MYKLRALKKIDGIERQYEMVGMKCPICNKKGWCVINESQTQVVCMRISNEGHSRVMGGTLYYLDNPSGQKIDFKDVDDTVTEELQTPNMLHKVYTLVANLLGLTSQDLDHLINERGLSEEQIALRGYFSTSGDNLFKQVVEGETTVWEELFVQNGLPKDAWKGIPGFSWDENHGCPLFTAKKGIAIPCRNEFGQKIGAQVRVSADNISYWGDDINAPNQFSVRVRYTPKGLLYTVRNKEDFELEVESSCKVGDEIKHTINGTELTFKIKSGAKYVFVSSVGKPNGTAQVSLPHFAFTDDVLKLAEFDENGIGKVNLFNKIDVKSVVITEGLLKGDIIASHMPYNKLAKLKTQVVVSIAGVNVWGRAFRKLSKLGVKRLFSAFDQDFVDNNAVNLNMDDMLTEFNSKGIQTFLLTWEVGKGLDDCILAEGLDTIQINEY